MTTGDLTLSGEIAGLLRRGSPVVAASDHWSGVSYHPGIVAGQRGTLVSDDWEVAWLQGDECEAVLDASPEDLALDLTDPTGRVHAAWWVQENHESAILSDAEARAHTAALHGWIMTDDQIRTLRDLVRRLAGAP